MVSKELILAAAALVVGVFAACTDTRQNDAAICIAMCNPRKVIRMEMRAFGGISCECAEQTCPERAPLRDPAALREQDDLTPGGVDSDTHDPSATGAALTLPTGSGDAGGRVGPNPSDTTGAWRGPTMRTGAGIEPDPGVNLSAVRPDTRSGDVGVYPARQADPAAADLLRANCNGDPHCGKWCESGTRPKCFALKGHAVEGIIRCDCEDGTAVQDWKPANPAALAAYRESLALGLLPGADEVPNE